MTIIEDMLVDLDALLDELLSLIVSLTAINEHLHVILLKISNTSLHGLLIWSTHDQEMVVLVADLRRLIVHA